MRHSAPRRWTIVHDFCFDYGGAERVTETIAELLLPESDVLFLAGRDEVVDRMGVSARSHFLFPRSLVTRGNYRQLAPLYPIWLAGTRPLPGNVLASSYAFAHHVRCTGRRVVFCHSPLRQIWSGESEYVRRANRATRIAWPVIGAFLRRADRSAARKADIYVASNDAVRRRLMRYYGIDAAGVVRLPVDTSEFFFDSSVKRKDFFLWAGRIVEPYKKLGLLLNAFADLGERLVVAGTGRDEATLRRVAPPNVSFVGNLHSSALGDLYRTAQAVIFPSDDDFGMVPIEAMACGTPVIAYRKGGAVETIIEGETGIFFDNHDVRTIRSAIARFKRTEWSHQSIASHGSLFTVDSFVSNLSQAANLLTASYAEFLLVSQ